MKAQPKDRYNMHLIAGMDTPSLLELKCKIEADLDEIKLQIDTAKGIYAQEGTLSDPEWFAKIKYARRIIGRKSQRIQLELSRRRLELSQRHKDTHDSFERAFVAIAKRELTRDVFLAIVEEANSEVAETAANHPQGESDIRDSCGNR